jgi:hypothetical protein
MGQTVQAVKAMRRFFTLLGFLGLLAACSGRFEYVRPMSSEIPAQSRVVTKTMDDVWRQASTGSIREGFAVTRVDKNAGIITVAYSGNPERYVDCGHITSYVKNVRGERIYRFPAAAAATDYELMTGREIVSIARQMVLDAQIAVTAIPIGSQAARVSASARYVLARTMRIRDTQGGVRTASDHISFTSDQEGSFPGGVACRANGQLEADVLSAFAP